MTSNGPDAARVEHRVGTHQWNDGRTVCGRDFVVFETGLSDTVSPDTFGYVTCATCGKRLPKDIVALDYCRKRAAAGDIDLEAWDEVRKLKNQIWPWVADWVETFNWKRPPAWLVDAPTNKVLLP